MRMEQGKGVESSAAVVSPLRLASNASTCPESPPPHAPDRTSASAGPTSRTGGMGRRRALKRARRQGGGALPTRRWGGTRVALMEPGAVMTVSTIAFASGGVCLIFAVFSGPALVFLAIVAMGVCGMSYSIRQRGALEYLPRVVTDLLTRTTLLEFLTDTSVFDAVKTYLVFMMGLSPEETEGVLRSLPEDMRETLTRPGLMHTLPRPLQGLLLPPSQGLSAANEGQESGVRQRQRRVAAASSDEPRGEAADRVPSATERGRQRLSVPERDPPLGQLVWHPLPSSPALELPRGEEEQAFEGHSDVEEASDEHDSVDGAAEGGEEDNRVGSDLGDENEQEDSYANLGDGHSDADAPRDTAPSSRSRAVGGANGAARCPPRDESPPHSRSLSPTSTRRRGLGLPFTDGRRLSAAESPRTSSSLLPLPAPREASTAGLGGRASGNSAALPVPVPVPAAATGFVPSAERIVASILQSRVDNAVRAAWNVVDERGIRRAAVGSGIALAAHIALSERARRQASSMLRGGLLAALAGTATVCAGLVYLKPGPPTGEQASSATTPEAPSVGTESASLGRSREGVGPQGVDRQERMPPRLSKYRAVLRRGLSAMTPSARNMVRLLAMICLLLAVRKWQFLRRAVMHAAIPKSMYGRPPP